ncbi:hypothetical protein [Gluconobacter aidae]|uniref:Lipoprotein n=1 Tax=Gluconobacter aidae TaxID=2662454 RepID=A0A7X1SP47_9PROT|nr:hypothetical protein [Gluconobacter aidae]MQR98122.1 hypothetical protein [Gluconobacter aidae]
MPRTTLPATILLTPLLMMGGCTSRAALSPDLENALARNQHGHPFSTARNSVAFLGEPDLSSATPANLVGTLHYCRQSSILTGSDTVAAVLVRNDRAYVTGKQGILQALSLRTGQREQYALPSMPTPLRQIVCTSVASRLRQPA